MKWPISQVAAWIDAEIEGNAEIEVDRISRIEEAEEGSISFLANPKYTPFLYTSKATAIIVSRDLVLKQAISPTLLRVDDPYAAFGKLLQVYKDISSVEMKGIDSQAHISAEAKLAEDVFVGPFAYIGKGSIIESGAKIYPYAYVGENVRIGKNTTVYPQVVIYHNCEIGNNCILHAGCVIGSDGFGFAPQEDGSYEKIPQTGNVKLEDEVEVGANATLDRATLGSTVIKRGVKLDNLVQIAHNVEVGENSVIAAQSGIAGSTKLGKYVMIGGQVGIVGHLEIADQTKIDAQSGVNRSIRESGKAFRGSPIQPFRQQLKSEVLFRKLEQLQQRIQELERRQQDLKN